MNALIIEDEGVAARRLTRMVEALGIEVLAQIPSNKKFMDYLATHDEPDIYFLDIHLSDGHVFESLSQLSLKAPIIFTTAFEEYAIKAFKQNSIDYLLKPIDEKELASAIDKYKNIYSSKNIVDIEKLSQLFNIAPVKSYK